MAELGLQELQTQREEVEAYPIQVEVEVEECQGLQEMEEVGGCQYPQAEEEEVGGCQYSQAKEGVGGWQYPQADQGEVRAEEWYYFQGEEVGVVCCFLLVMKGVEAGVGQ